MKNTVSPEETGLEDSILSIIKKKENKKNVLAEAENNNAAAKVKKTQLAAGKKDKKKKPSSETLISLDFGTREIKGVYGKVQGKKLRISGFFTEPVNEEWYKNGSIRNEQAGLSALQRLLSSKGISTKNVVCTIEGTNIVKREMVVPKLSKEDMDALLQYEMGQYLPINPSEYIMQYIEMEHFIEDNVEKLRLLVIVIPKVAVEGILGLIHKAKLNPYALDVHFNSMRKLIGFNEGKINEDSVSDKTVALIDIGSSNTDIIVLKEGEFQFNVLLEVGYSDFEKTVGSELEIKGHELSSKTDELLKRLPEYSDIGIGEPQDKDGYLFRLLQSRMEAYISEIERSLKYYTTQASTNRVHKIYIYGGGSVEHGLASLVEKQLEIPTDYLKSMDCIETGAGAERYIAKFWNAIGALIRL